MTNEIPGAAPFTAPYPIPEPIQELRTKRIRLKRTEPDTFKRVLVMRPGETKHTTVCLTNVQYEDALRLAYGVPALVNSTLRAAALTAGPAVSQKFSVIVRKKAMASLRGQYRPDVAAQADAAAQALAAAKALAAANNTAWEQS